MNLELLLNFSKNFAKCLENPEGYNVIIRIGEGPDIKTFKAHSFVLKAQCPYFNAGLSSEWVKKEGDNIVFEKQNISADVFNIILKYLYTGMVSIDDCLPSKITDLLCAADELILPEMIAYVEEQFILQHNKWLYENFDKILHTAFKHDLWKKLQEFCLDHICPNPDIVFRSSNFLQCDESILENLLQRDDLNMKENMLWDFLVQWGCGQTPPLGNNFMEWSDENFSTLKERLHKCIPHIRLSAISPEDFYAKVRPLKKIFPEELYEEVLWHYIKPRNALKFNLIHPPRSDPVNSSIINLKHVAMIASWVDPNHVDNAIYIYPSYGPQWGQNDLKTWGSFNADCCQCLRQRYEYPIRSSPDVFSAEEFEVFHLVKRQ
ncbi:5642_t:CDS:2 [Dentiscutata erythropus]|uniref:5642_t:CDS:1 n=1 Tax=Dentiscutata erythropus TaxID=1348616 RepID=A0A9N9IGH3_9GLOM|nr:5642_t:CDS:2 [Dentiscutata erythropus]